MQDGLMDEVERSVDIIKNEKKNLFNLSMYSNNK